MKKTIFFSLILLLSIGNILQAATRRVPSQYAEIQLAVRDCNDGDVIIVDPGIYYETINFSGKNIILTSTDPNDPNVVAGTIIDADGDGSVVTFENGETSQAVLTGFTISGGFGTLNTDLNPEVRILWGGGVYCAGSSPTITKNIFTGNSAPNEVFGNVEDLIIGYGGAIGGAGASPTITRNIIKGNTAYAGAGIFIFGDPVISSNLIYSNSGFIGGGVIMAGGSLSNNTIAGNDASLDGGAQLGGNIHIVFSPDVGSTRIFNNIIFGATSGGGITWEGVYQEGIIQFNNVWNNAPANYGFADSATGEFTFDGRADQTGVDDNISQDPLFVDVQAGDYHLQSGSPCVNTGDPGIVPALGETDFDGELRMYAARIDIGAYEYVGYVKPVANAGPDQHIDSPGLITLDGGGSFFYDPDGVKEFSWEQVAGSAVVMSDFAAMQPTIVPESEGEYRFELVVSDGVNISEPDEVLIIVRNRAPLADAGPDQSTSSIPSVITLDGSASSDPGGVPLTYHWTQTSGPAVILSNANADNPTFIPSQIGIYVFELVVNDGQLDSVPDIIGIVIGSRAPIADAGLPRYTARDPVVLDGSESFDPDGFGQLTYQWQQVSGQAVDITDENTAMPTISGFSQTNEIQKCLLELTVSDGDLNGHPDTVEVVIIPDFGSNDLVQLNPPFEPNKPTIVAFGGGDCVMGVAMVFTNPADWYAKANFLTISSYGPPYYQYGDALITYLSSVAPAGYTQPIQTMGFSTGNLPAIDVAVRLNETYADARFAVNRVSLLDAACRDYTDDIAKLISTSVDGERCWIDNYYATAGRFYPGTLNIRFPAPPAEHSTPFVWFQQSNNPGGGARSRPVYNGGVTAGYYLSVAGPGKNLQLASDPENYYFEWNSQTGSLRFYNESLYPGRIPEAVKLVGPADGTLADANGAVLSCQASENAIGYQLLFGPTAHELNYLVSDTPNPPEEVITEFPFETTYWTIRVHDEYGSTVYADPIRIKSGNVTAQVIENVNTGKKYNSIQRAIDNAGEGEEIVVDPGIYQYFENIDFKGKALTLRSIDPNDPAVVAATVINGTGHGPAVNFSGAEDANSVLAGFTITGGNAGIYCSGTSPLITRCNIVGNVGAGIELHNGSNPAITNCDIISNTGSGIAMVDILGGRNLIYNKPEITNCLIAENYQHGISGGIPNITNCTIVANGQSGVSSSKPVIYNSIIYYNALNSDLVQIESNAAEITYTDVQGGWPGQGNIDADPLFADPDNSDYHLKSQAGRWDLTGQSWSADDVTSPCIDAGAPDTPIHLEPLPNGGIINMGAYGGTSLASKSIDNGE